MNTTNPTTAEDYNALQALYAAKAAAADAQAKMIASEKALAASQVGDSPAAAQLAAVTAAANLSAQQKTLSDNKAAILKNNFAVPDSGYTGAVTVGDKAGVIEAALLSTSAANVAAKGIAAAIGKPSKIVLFTTTDLPDFQGLIAFGAQCDAAGKLLDGATAMIDVQLGNSARLLPPTVEFVTPEIIGAAFDAANKLLGFFRTDYSIQGVAVTPDDLLLMNSLAGALRANNADASVLIPAIYNIDALKKDSDVAKTLNDLAGKRTVLQQKTDLAYTRIDTLTKAAGAEADAVKKKGLTDAANDLKAAADQGKAASTLYDSLVSKLTAPDDKGKVPLTAVVQQSAVKKALDGGAILVTAKISYMGGAYYTRKNLWSFLGGMPFFNMGGIVVTFNAVNGTTGSVVAAGSIPIDGGFHKLGNLPKELGSYPTP